MKIEKPNKTNSDHRSISRRNFFKKALAGAAVIAMKPDVLLSNISNIIETGSVHTEFKKTSEMFPNKEFVWGVESEGKRVGEFWPIHGINLVTKETDPELFEGEIADIQKELRGSATAPDGMTTGSVGSYEMQGKSLTKGIECGDGVVYNYGIVVVENGFNISFTHNKEIPNFDEYYENAKEEKKTLFFLPSIYRNGNFLASQNVIDKILIRRDVPDSKDPTKKKAQIGVILFDTLTTYDRAREIVLGLDREDQNTNQSISKTTHIYVLDGGPKWGQAIKEVNGKVETKGTRDKEVITNYLVFY